MEVGRSANKPSVNEICYRGKGRDEWRITKLRTRRNQLCCKKILRPGANEIVEDKIRLPSVDIHGNVGAKASGADGL